MINHLFNFISNFGIFTKSLFNNHWIYTEHKTTVVGKIFLSLGYSGNENSITPLVMTALTGANHMGFRGFIMINQVGAQIIKDTYDRFNGTYKEESGFTSVYNPVKYWEKLQSKPYQLFHDIASLVFIYDVFKYDYNPDSTIRPIGIGLKHPYLVCLYAFTIAMKNVIDIGDTQKNSDKESESIFRFINPDYYFQKIFSAKYTDFLSKVWDTTNSYFTQNSSSFLQNLNNTIENSSNNLKNESCNIKKLQEEIESLYEKLARNESVDSIYSDLATSAQKLSDIINAKIHINNELNTTDIPFNITPIEINLANDITNESYFTINSYDIGYNQNCHNNLNNYEDSYNLDHNHTIEENYFTYIA